MGTVPHLRAAALAALVSMSFIVVAAPRAGAASIAAPTQLPRSAAVAPARATRVIGFRYPTTTLRVRSGPSTSYLTRAVVGAGTRLAEIAARRDRAGSVWVEVRTPTGTVGWVASRYTSTSTSRHLAPAIRPVAYVSHLWPLPLRGMITTRFSSAHLGIDVAAPAGTPVRAIAAGTVAWAGWKNNGGGNVVVISHPDGMISTYNHNRGVAVHVGQRVSQGETIAWVGMTGWATGPHLDFRIEMGGRFVDPLQVY